MIVFKSNVGDEAQAPLVDADQRYAKFGQLAANAQHGAVTAHHQRQVTLRTNGRHIQNRVLCQSGAAGCVFFNRHIAALGI